MARWSQSQSNPIKEIEISLRGKAEQNGDRMFFRGRKWFISALIKGKGEPADRNYRLDILPWEQACKLKFKLGELISCFCCVHTSHTAFEADSWGSGGT